MNAIRIQRGRRSFIRQRDVIKDNFMEKVTLNAEWKVEFRKTKT